MTNPNRGFYKSEDCPASDELLAFQNGGIRFALSSDICDHLLECEFCMAEVEFYRHYPPVEEAVAPAGKIPKPLFELADALLRKDRDLSPLNRLIGD